MSPLIDPSILSKHLSQKMKISLKILICAVGALVSSAHGSVTLSINTGGWGSDGADSVNNMPWGVIISSDGAGFGGTALDDLAAALEGFVIPAIASPSSPVQIGATNFYFARAQTDTQTGPPPTFTGGLMNSAQFLLGTEVTSNDPVGLLWFPTDTSAGSPFGFYDLATTLPSDGGTLQPASVASRATNVIGVPEPSRALLLGMALVGLVVRRRRVR